MKKLIFSILIVLYFSLVALSQEKRAYFITKNTYVTYFNSNYFITTTNKDIYEKLLLKFRGKDNTKITKDFPQYYTILFTDGKRSEVETYIKSL